MRGREEDNKREREKKRIGKEKRERESEREREGGRLQMAASVTPQEGGRERESEKETVRGRESVRERGNSSPTRSDCKRLIERAVLLISSFMENMTGRLNTNKN